MDILRSKHLVVTLCAWEIAAILTGKVPSITRTHKDHPWFGFALWAAIGWHFWSARKGKVTCAT